jgi:hypothetical protein
VSSLYSSTGYSINLRSVRNEKQSLAVSDQRTFKTTPPSQGGRSACKARIVTHPRIRQAQPPLDLQQLLNLVLREKLERLADLLRD